jgi:hypothetical protein
MSRSGYTDDTDDQWGLIRWRGAVRSAIRGARGQVMLRELAAALDAMPEKRLAAESLVNADGEFCTLGALGHARGLDMSVLDPEDPEAVAKAFGVSPALVCEIVFENDEGAAEDWLEIDTEIHGPMRRWERHQRIERVPNPRAAEQRWANMRKWVAENLIAQIGGGR